MGLIQNKVTVSQPNSHVVVKNAGGLRGLTGETGPQGHQGVPGEAATVTAGTTTTLPAGSDATVQNVGSTSAAIFNFGIPKGDKGDTGESGAAATISVGTTTTLEPGEDATVTNTGTSSAAVFDFGIPKGAKGDTGDTGPAGQDGADGFSPTATVSKTGDTATITITDKDGTTTASISDGTTPTVNDGTLTIQKNGTTVQTFSADQASNVTANITVPTQFSELSGTVSSSQIEDVAITTGSVSGTGTNITLAGTMEGGAFESVELNGDTEQTTYSGKNLYQSIGKSTASGGLTSTITSNGEFHVTGTATDSSSTFSTTMNTSLPAGSYVLSITKTLPFNILLRASNNQNIGVITAGNKSVTITTTTTLTSLWVWAYPLTNNTAYDETFGVQLESGSTATSFEPYVGGTASPNPDYPQEVQTVTGEQSVLLNAKNWLDQSTMEQGTFNYINGQETAHTGIIRSGYIPCKPNTAYTISSDQTLGEIGVVYTDADGNIEQGFAQSTTNKQYTFTTKPNVSQMRIRVGIGAYPHTAGTDYKLQLELGSTPTAYEPYKGVTKTVNLGKNLCNPADVTDIFLYTLADKAAYLSGNTSVVIPVEQNTKYTVSTAETQSRYRVAVCDSIPVQGGGDVTCYSGTNIDNTSNNVTIRTGTHKYLIVNATDFTKIQIEKGSTATTYAPYFTPIELCKISTYRDYIYKNGDNWYVKKHVGKLLFTGAESWERNVYAGKYYFTLYTTIVGQQYGWSNNFGILTVGGPLTSNVNVIRASQDRIDLIMDGSELSLDDFKDWLSSHNTSYYYYLSTPTDTQITNATLISELEGLLSAATYSGTTYITVSGDLSSPLEVVAEADSKLAPDSVYGAAIKDGAVSTDKIEDGAVTPAKISTSAYQSGETAVGTWIDGKTIYRQVLTGTVQITANNAATVTTTIAAKSIVSTSGWYQSWKQNDTTSNKVAFGQLMGNNIYSYALIRSGNYIELGFISSVNVTSQYEVVVEYTKKD